MLIGCRMELSPEEERRLLRPGVNDFSVIEKVVGGANTSCPKRQCFLWLGPAAYLNHDCRNNCEVGPIRALSQAPRGAEGSVFCHRQITCYSRDAPKHVTTRAIPCGEEVLIFYGRHFFGPGNENCECCSCEHAQQGAFRSRVGPSFRDLLATGPGMKPTYLLRDRTLKRRGQRASQASASDVMCAQISRE